MKIKPVTMWAVCSGRCNIANWSIRRTQCSSIAAFLDGDCDSWRKYRDDGWRCIKVTVAPAEGGKL